VRIPKPPRDGCPKLLFAARTVVSATNASEWREIALPTFRLRIEPCTPTMARAMPRILSAGAASRFTNPSREGKLIYVTLNIQTPCPTFRLRSELRRDKRGAVPVNSGRKWNFRRANQSTRGAKELCAGAGSRRRTFLERSEVRLLLLNPNARPTSALSRLTRQGHGRLFHSVPPGPNVGHGCECSSYVGWMMFKRLRSTICG
jgi:hypothetical protein